MRPDDASESVPATAGRILGTAFTGKRENPVSWEPDLSIHRVRAATATFSVADRQR